MKVFSNLYGCQKLQNGISSWRSSGQKIISSFLHGFLKINFPGVVSTLSLKRALLIKVSSYICQIQILQKGIYFRAKNINFLLFDAVYFTKVDHASKLKSNVKYKNILAYESFQVFCQCMSEVKIGIFFMLELNLIIIDVLEFEDVTTQPCIKT